jgi:DNA (cytosine-5)-methyltransferase 1
MRELALFAGAGGGILGGLLLGWRTVCAVEFDPYCRQVLLARQRDGVLPRFPIWDDVRTFDCEPWRGHVDIISGGFPCQDISCAGKGAGITGERSGLWSEFSRIIREVGPRYVLVENSPALASRGLGVVLGDLASMGFDARWGVLGADNVGAPHRRKRIWIVARHPDRDIESALPVDEEVAELRSVAADANREQLRIEPGRRSGAGRPSAGVAGDDGAQGDMAAERAGWWDAEPDVGRVVDGVAHRVDRLRALGNGQVPAVAALAWRMLRP